MRSTSILEEFQISRQVQNEIRELLALCFPAEPAMESRTYLKQIPPRRILVRSEGRLIGHAGLEHRVVGFRGTPARIFGVADLCVHPAARSQGVGSGVLHKVADLATISRADFIVLFASDQRLYLQNGFRSVNNHVRWLKIDEHQSLSIGSESVPELMVKEIGARPWPDEPLDLLGHLF